MDKEQYWGITEAGEISFSLDAFDHLYRGNTIITKRLTKPLNEKLIEHKDKCILHLTCTGFAGTKIEPFVPSVEKTHEMLLELLDGGFPVRQVVLRIDPIIPTDKGWERAKNVVETFSDCGITRVRFSILDMYNHVKERFAEAGFPLPYQTFHAPLQKRLEIRDNLLSLGTAYGFEVEACGEPDIESVPCLSQKDVDILGLTDVIKLENSKGQRKSCHCPENKHELLRVKPHRCNNACLYCFWKD